MKTENKLLNELRKELKEIQIIKAQLKEQQKNLNERLDQVDELQLEYTNMISAHIRAEPKGLYM